MRLLGVVVNRMDIVGVPSLRGTTAEIVKVVVVRYLTTKVRHVNIRDGSLTETTRTTIHEPTP